MSALPISLVLLILSSWMVDQSGAINTSVYDDQDDVYETLFGEKLPENCKFQKVSESDTYEDIAKRHAECEHAFSDKTEWAKLDFIAGAIVLRIHNDIDKYIEKRFPDATCHPTYADDFMQATYGSNEWIMKGNFVDVIKKNFVYKCLVHSIEGMRKEAEEVVASMQY